ncbi:MAG TPA: hypothetical protein VF641_00015 [Methylobacterium sp.]
MRAIPFTPLQLVQGQGRTMPYDPFAARNLVSAFALAGLLVMMTGAAPLETCVGIGLACLVASGAAALFSGAPPKRAGQRRPANRPGADKPRATVEARNPAPAIRSWRAPPPEPAVEAHPAIFATVAGRTTGASGSRRR